MNEESKVQSPKSKVQGPKPTRVVSPRSGVLDLVMVAAIALVATSCSSAAPAVPFEAESSHRASRPVETATASDLSLEEALALAERNHPELAEAKARWEASVGRAHQAGAWPNPALIARMESAPLRGGGAGEAEFLAGISQSLPVGGRLEAAHRAEALEAERLLLEFEAARRTVRSRVQAAFAAALFADQVLALHREAASDAEKAVALAGSLAAAGEALAVDVSRARIERVRVLQERDRAGSLSEEARVALTAAIGVAGLEIKSIEGSLETAIELPALESLAAELAHHPLLKAARAGVLAQEARLELAQAQRIPDINLDLLYRRLENTVEDAFDVGLSVTLPVFNRNRGAVREARADRRAAQARAEMNAIDLSRELQHAHLRLKRALAASRTLKEEVVTQQDEIARAYEARYEAGDASLGDLLPIRRDRIAARLAHLDALREVMESWSKLSQFVAT